MTGIGIGFFGFLRADFRGFFFKLLSTDGVVSEVAAEPDTPLSCIISGTALKEGLYFSNYFSNLFDVSSLELSFGHPFSLGTTRES